MNEMLSIFFIIAGIGVILITIKWWKTLGAPNLLLGLFIFLSGFLSLASIKGYEVSTFQGLLGWFFPNFSNSLVTAEVEEKMSMQEGEYGMNMDLLLLLNIIVPIVLLIALVATKNRIMDKEGARIWSLYFVALLLLLSHGLSYAFQIGSPELRLLMLMAFFTFLALALLSRRNFANYRGSVFEKNDCLENRCWRVRYEGSTDLG